MRIEYLHASKFGNGRTVGEAFARQVGSADTLVDVHHIRELKPGSLPAADLYVFSSPARLGKPIRRMRRFLSKLELPTGTPYALLTTEMVPQPDKTDSLQQVRKIMDKILQGKGLVKVTEDVVHVTGLRGPLEEGWEDTVAAFASRLPIASTGGQPTVAAEPQHDSGDWRPRQDSNLRPAD